MKQPMQSPLQKLSFWLLLFISVGTPGLLVQDMTGITVAHGLFNINNLWRIFVYFVAGAGFLLAFLLTSARSPHYRVSGVCFTGLQWVFWLNFFFLITYPFASISYTSTTHIETFYRFAEWVMVALFAVFAFPAPQSADDYYQLKRIFIRFGKLFTFFVSFSVILVALVKPELAYFPSPGGPGQLGGFFVHPNKLSLICAAGVLFFGLFGKTWPERLWIPVFIAVAYFSESRIGLLVTLSCFALVLVSAGRGAGKLVRLFFMSITALLGLLVLLSSISALTDISFLARGMSLADIVSLNNRTVVWESCIRLFLESPLLGWGYIDGPLLIADYMTQTWWKARHAQNDLLNAIVSGGALPGFFVLYIYSVLIMRTLPRALSGDIHTLLFGLMVICFIHSVVEIVIISHVTLASILLVMTYRYLAVTRPWLRADMARP